MAGYSGTPLPKKLGIKDGHRVAWLGDRGRPAIPGDLPEGVAASRALRGQAPLDLIAFFSRMRSELEARLPALKDRLQESGGLWLCWPKKASGVATDLSDGLVRELGLGAGLVDNKTCAIDETWSGLRFVYRLKDRKGARPTARK